MRVRLEGCPDFTFRIRSEKGPSRLVQHDTEFQDVARAFGWSSSHDEDSPEAIWEAYEFLENHFGDWIEDPGYF